MFYDETSSSQWREGAFLGIIIISRRHSRYSNAEEIAGFLHLAAARAADTTMCGLPNKSAKKS